MSYKVIFHAFIDGKKQNLDAVFESEVEPKITDSVVIRAVMNSLAEVVEVQSPDFTIDFHIEIVLPVA